MKDQEIIDWMNECIIGMNVEDMDSLEDGVDENGHEFYWEAWYDRQENCVCFSTSINMFPFAIGHKDENGEPVIEWNNQQLKKTA